MTDITTIDFDNLVNRELAEIAELISDHPERAREYINHLVSYLQLNETSGSAIEERLYLLGLRHLSTFPTQLLSELNQEITKRVRAPMSAYFLSGSTTGEGKDTPSNEIYLSPP